MTSVDRFYVKFKGRVLGPISEERFRDLVRRKQVDETQEVSADGIHWREASTFPGLFEDTTRREPDSPPVVDSPSEKYFLTIDGATHGPYARDYLENMARLNQLTKDTPVFLPGTQTWVKAGVSFPEWFREENPKGEQQRIHTSGPEEKSGNLDANALLQKVYSERGWVYFVAIAGVLLSLANAGVHLISLVAAVVNQSYDIAAISMLQAAIQASPIAVFSFLIWVAIGFSRASTSTNEANAFILVKRLNLFWRIFGISMIFGFVCYFLILVALVGQAL